MLTIEYRFPKKYKKRLLKTVAGHVDENGKLIVMEAVDIEFRQRKEADRMLMFGRTSERRRGYDL